MVSGHNGPISNVLFLAGKVNETAKELVPAHPPQEAELTAQEITSKRYIVIMDRAQARCLNVCLHCFPKLVDRSPQDFLFK